MTQSRLIENWRATLARIEAAALRYGRPTDSVRLLAVSKAQPAESLRQIAEAGQCEFGENYLQEALAKIAALADLKIAWHFIGQIQGNKTRPIAEHFHWAHTVDRERIAIRLNEQRPSDIAPLNICIQVRLEDELGKGGVEPHELPALAASISKLPRLKLRGLMCIPPPRDSFDDQRELFARLKQLHDELRARGFDIDTLSMGMSGDLDAAIAAGSSIVRVGTAIFGERV